MAHDQRHTPPTRDDDPSPHQEDIRSRHELDEDRHRRDHYNHHDERRERPPADEHHRPAPNDREETDRREDHHHREDLDNRRFRHDDHHNDYPGENHHHGDRGGADRRENPDRHEEARHHPQDDRPTDARPDDRDHRPDDRHLRPAGGNGAPDDRENHNHPHPHHQSPPDRSDAPDAVGNGNANVPPRHDVRPHSPPPHPQQHDPNAPEDAGAPSSSDIPIDDSLVNLFVRNVAKHVQETQLIDLFNKVCMINFSDSSILFLLLQCFIPFTRFFIFIILHQFSSQLSTLDQPFRPILSSNLNFVHLLPFLPRFRQTSSAQNYSFLKTKSEIAHD